MIIEHIELSQWRHLQHLALRFAPGINTIFGPNEGGKSTIIEAIHTALFGDTSSSAQSYKELIPWKTAVKAKVSLILKNRNNERYRIEKSFPQGEASITFLDTSPDDDPTTAKGHRIAEGKQVNPVLLQKLGLEGDHQSLTGLLWIPQGEVLNLFRNLGKKTNRTLVEIPLQRRIEEVIKERLSSPIADEFLSELEEERDSYLKSDGTYKTAKGSKGKAILDIKAELRETDQSLQRCEIELKEFRKKADQLQALEATIASAEERLEETRGYAVHLRKKKTACDTLKELTLTVTPLIEKKERLDTLIEDQKKIEKLLPAAYSKRAALVDRELADARTALDAHDEIAERLKKTEVERAAIPAMTKDTVRTADDLERKIQRIEDALQRTEFHLRFSPVKPLKAGISVDGADEESITLSEEKSFTAAREVTFTYPDHFSMAITGPLSEDEFNTMRESYAEYKRTLQSILSTNRANSVEELRRLFDRKKELDATLDQLQKQVSRTDRRELLDRISVLEQEQSSPMDLFGGGNLNYLPNEVAAKKTVTEIKHFIELSEQGAKTIKENIDMILKGEPQESFYRTVEEYRDRRRSQEQLVRTLPPKEITDITESSIEQRETEIADLQEKVTSLKSEKTGLETEMRNQEDLEEKINTLTYTKQRLQQELHHEVVHISAIQTLIRIVKKAKERREHDIVIPIQQKLSRAFAQVTESRYDAVELEKEFSGISVTTTVYDNSRFTITPESLSIGTQEQLSFLFRLCLAEHLSEDEPQIMVLDESFVNTDTERKKILLSLMQEAKNDIQFLLFTCTEADYTLFGECGRAIDLGGLVSP